MLEEQLNKIKDTQRQIAQTNSIKRKRDLQRHLNKLWKEYEIARRQYGIESRIPTD